MAKKKIAIIGRGTVGCTAVTFFTGPDVDWDVDWYYDPLIKPTPVGEGTTLKPPRYWRDSGLFPLSEDMVSLRSTNKVGIRKRNWGNQGNDFMHSFPLGETGLHFSGVVFQDLAFEKLKQHPNVTCIERNVKPEDIDSDVVLCCAGTPSDFDEHFTIAAGIPVNAALVSQCPWDHCQFDYTLTYAMPSGWIFGIPLRDRCSIGYVHNSSFTTREQAADEVQPLLDELGLTPASQNYLQFKNYYRKQNFTERVAYAGNASYFLEPLEATSIDTSIDIMRMCVELWGGNDKVSLEGANNWYHGSLKNLELMIAMHYSAGSVFDNSFWKHARTVGVQRLISGFENNEPFVNNLYKVCKHRPHPMIDVEHAATWDFAHSYLKNADELGISHEIVHMGSNYKLDRINYDWEN